MKTTFKSSLYRMYKSYACAAVLMFCANALWAAPPTATVQQEMVSKESLDLFKELSNAKLDAAKESMQKDYMLLQSRMTQQEKLSLQQNNRFDEFQYKLDMTIVFAVIFALFMAMLILLLYFSVRAHSKHDPREAMKQGFDESKKLLEQQAQDMARKLDALQADVKQKMLQAPKDNVLHIQSKLEPTAPMAQPVEVPTTISSRRMVERSPERSSMPNSDNAMFMDVQYIQPMSNAHAAVPPTPSEEHFRFVDWDRKGYAAYESDDKELAISYWSKAFLADDALDEQAATSLFNIASAQGELGRRKEAIGTFEDMLDRFWSIDSPSIQLLCAKALVKKGELLTVPDLT